MKNYLLIILLAFLSNLTHSTEFDDKLELAKQGDASAQYNLGLMYDAGRGVQQDDKTAVMWYTKAAEQGDADAQSILGFMYASGQGVQQNDKTAVIWYTKAAEQGDADAQSILGFMYANGEGVPENDKTAVMWYRKAAEQGFADAQLYLGLMSHSSQPVDGFPKNNKTAAMWLAKAAEQGDARAQFFLGYIYATGEGVPENDIKAYAWSSMAKANGYNIDGAAKIIKERMTKEQIAKAQDLAAKCYASDYKDCD